jgi:hypothetical protein
MVLDYNIAKSILESYSGIPQCKEDQLALLRLAGVNINKLKGKLSGESKYKQIYAVSARVYEEAKAVLNMKNQASKSDSKLDRAIRECERDWADKLYELFNISDRTLVSPQELEDKLLWD